jgi:hypothetical protein
MNFTVALALLASSGQDQATTQLATFRRRRKKRKIPA